jgi:4-amino-4-deoxy-L-arabinose transferase-like glycosyltransferase
MTPGNFIQQLLHLEDFNYKHWLVVFGFFVCLHLPDIVNDKRYANLSVMQAEAFLEGRLDLKNFYWDVSEFEGKYFNPFPPLPAIISVPFVWLFGAKHVSVVSICIAISLISVFCLIRIIQKLKVPKEYRIWILLGIFFGTGYWFTLVTSHHVYGFAHVTSFALLLLSILEFLGKRRAVLIGILIGSSFLCRQMTIFYSVFFVIYFFFSLDGAKRFIKPVVLVLTLTPFIFFYFILNYLRFHNPFDTGYAYLSYIPMFQSRVDQYGLFSLRYLPYNFYSLFVKGPNITFTGTNMISIMDVDLMGTSITMASPFVFVAFKAQCEQLLKASGWLAIFIVMFGGLLYFNNGFEQVNTMRFFLDFLPLLVVFICYGCSALPKWLFRNLVVYSILLNIILFLVHYFYQ